MAGRSSTRRYQVAAALGAVTFVASAIAVGPATADSHRPAPTAGTVARAVTPSPPPVRSVTPGTATIRVTWGDPGSATAVTGFRVAERALRGSTSTWTAWHTVDLPPGVHEHVWTSLTNGVRHEVKVAAQNLSGWGAYGATRRATPLSWLIDRGIRRQVRDTYRQRLVRALAVPNKWTGSVGGCKAGTNSSQYRKATLSAVNYMRALTDARPVTLAARFNRPAQKAALMMQANDSLSHDPPPGWKCFSQAGHRAAGHSNLALGAAGAQAISLYMSDPGSGNEIAGHRRWIIYERQKVMGTGDTGFANDLWVLGPWSAHAPSGTPPYQAWPNSGFFPRALEPDGRWSLTSPRGASFGSAKVTMTGPGGKPVALKTYPTVDYYGDNTLVWQLRTAPSHATSADRTYTVHVTGIRGPHGGRVSHAYRVTLVS